MTFQTNDRFKKDNGYHVVPPPLTGNYMPPLADLSFAGLDDSVYRPTANKTSASVSQVEASTSQTSNTSVEMPRVESVRPSRVIIEDWVSDDEDIFQSNDLQATDKPSFKRIEFTNARNESVKPKQAEKPRMITQNPKGVKLAGQIAVSAVKGNGVTAVKASAGCVWRPKMTDLNNGTKTSLMTIKTSMEVLLPLVVELNFNLFSVSQMCDKKNNVLFAEIECLVPSPDFKLLDENQVLLRVPRQSNMYNFDLRNVVPSGDLTCLFANATIDESKL
ncbi:hypothetical protein Tco_1243898 [Tanacetum coccineum]